MSDDRRVAGNTASRVAWAKVNLTLAVTGRRADGYHELASVFLRVGLSDRLALDAVAATEMAPGDRLVVDDDPDCPIEGNLVLRAAAAVRAELARRAGTWSPGPRGSGAGSAAPALRFRLRKRIPIGAGLAGGSSDAAAALEMSATALGLELAPAERSRLAARLGADAPFFVGGHAAALVTGIGEQLEPLPAPRSDPCLLLVTPAVRLATRDVFAAYDALPRRPSSAATLTAELAASLHRGLEAAQLAALATELRDANDLWPAAVAVAPGLAALRAALETTLGRPFLLTGSGSTLVGLYASVADAVAAGSAAVSAGLPASADARLVAVDITHPDPIWRFP